MGMLPDNYKDAKTVKKELGGGGDPRYIDPGKMEDGETITVRPCGTYDSGHLVCGYEYFSESLKKSRRFVDFPENYLEDIGLSYKGRIEKTGEKDTPKYFMAMVVLSKETDQFCVLFIPQLKLRGQIERVFAIEDYQYEDGAIAPFYLSINRTGLKKDTEYLATPTLKPANPTESERWAQARDGIWLPALFDGADPFAGRPATPKGKAKPKGQPPEATDALGAAVTNDTQGPGDSGSW